MNKFFVRLFIACACFVFSVGLTNLWKLFHRTESQIVRLELSESSRRDLAYDEEQLRQIYREYGPAQTRHDRAFFEKIEAENFILFLHGTRFTREEDIRLMETWSSDIIYENQPEYIQIFGTSAVVRGRMEARYSDGPISSWGYIDVWVKRGDTWRIQSTTSPH